MKGFDSPETIKAHASEIILTCIFSYLTKSAFTWSKLAIETLEQGVKYVQS